MKVVALVFIILIVLAYVAMAIVLISMRIDSHTLWGFKNTLEEENEEIIKSEGGEKMKVNENGQIEYAIGECFAHHGRVFMCEMDDLYNPCVKCDFACDYSCDVRVACSETERSDGKSVRFVLLGGGGEK